MMIVFTSITLNYLPKAKILAKTLKQLHPDWQFRLVISDKIPSGMDNLFGQELNQPIFDKVVWIEELPISDINS